MEKVFVYFETTQDGVNSDGSHAELVAVFHSEDYYIACLPILEKEAEKIGMIVTETIGFN